MSLAIIFFITILIFIVINIFYKKNNQKNLIKIYFFMISLCVPFSISTSIISNSIDVSYFMRINYIFIVIICFWITTINLKTFVLTKIDFLFMIFILLIILNLLLNNNYEIGKSLELIILYLTLYLIFLISKKLSYECKEKILGLFSYVAIVNGVLSILQYIFGKKFLIGMWNDSILYTEGVKVTKRAIGLAGTNNSAGNLAVILFSICLYNYITKKGKKDLIALVMTIIASILTFTRISYLAITIEIIIYFFISNWSSLKAIISKIKIIFLLIMPILVILSMKINKIINTLFVERGNTQEYRFYQYNNIIEYCSNNIKFLNGIGIGQYRAYMLNNFSLKEIDLHSELLNVLVEMGWIAFILFLIINVMLFINAKKNANLTIQKAFIISLFVGNLICSNFNPNQYYYLNNVVYMIALCNLVKFKAINIKV